MHTLRAAGDVTDFKFAPSGKLAGTVGEDRKVIVWDLRKLPPTQAQNLSPELVSPQPYPCAPSHALVSRLSSGPDRFRDYLTPQTCLSISPWRVLYTGFKSPSPKAPVEGYEHRVT